MSELVRGDLDGGDETSPLDDGRVLGRADAADPGEPAHRRVGQVGLKHQLAPAKRRERSAYHGHGGSKA